MRWTTIVLLAITITSCKALKPVISSKADNKVVTRNRKPEFIENITISTSNSGYTPSGPTVTNNSAKDSSFSILPNMAPSSESYNTLQFKYAIIMGVPIEALNNMKLFSFIDEWYGTPYRFGGSTKEGIDCSAFSCDLMTTVFGAGLPRMAKDQYTACEHVKRNDLVEGDLVFFHTTRKGISHVGVFLGNNKFVHASLNYGVTISDLTDPYYSRTFRGGGRIKQTDTVSGN